MKNFMNNSLIEENKSIERTYDSLLAKSWQQQIMNNKPIRVGYNIWSMQRKKKLLPLLNEDYEKNFALWLMNI